MLLEFVKGVVHCWRSKGLVPPVEASVRVTGVPTDQQNHVKCVGDGDVLSLTPTLLQDLVTAEEARGLVHVDLVPFEVAEVGLDQVFQVELNAHSGIHLDGPVAPQWWVGAQVVRREELPTFSMQDLVTAPQSEECTATLVNLLI